MRFMSRPALALVLVFSPGCRSTQKALRPAAEQHGTTGKTKAEIASQKDDPTRWLDEINDSAEKRKEALIRLSRINARYGNLAKQKGEAGEQAHHRGEQERQGPAHHAALQAGHPGSEGKDHHPEPAAGALDALPGVEDQAVPRR